jgi:hypothetical protein
MGAFKFKLKGEQIVSNIFKNGGNVISNRSGFPLSHRGAAPLPDLCDKSRLFTYKGEISLLVK